MNHDTFPIIGMSPGNSYFKDEEVRHLLKTVIEKYGRTGVLIADVPAIATYIAFGYPENRARRDKAIPQGNAFKNRTNRIREELGYGPEMARIVDWDSEIEGNAAYGEHYRAIRNLYETNIAFKAAADATTREVLEHSGREIPDMAVAVKIAVHYLLSEFAFLEFAPVFFNVPKVSYVYHKNWPVYEDYISGRFDGFKRPHLDFILIENPYETFNPLWSYEGDADQSVFDTRVLRSAFTEYSPALMRDKARNVFSGIFFEVIERIAREQGWAVQWTEETGYGVIQDGLNAGRFDVFASTVWPTPERREHALFSRSLYASHAYCWVKADTKFQTLSDLHAHDGIRIAVKEGDISDSIAKDFQNARLVRVPQLAPVDSLLRLVVEGRADVTFAESYLAELFNGHSASEVLRIGEPIRSYENTFMFAKENMRLKELFDKELDAFIREGFVSELIKKYTGNSNTFGQA